MMLHAAASLLAPPVVPCVRRPARVRAHLAAPAGRAAVARSARLAQPVCNAARRRRVVAREAPEGGVSEVEVPTLSLELLTDRLSAATQARQLASVRIKSLEEEAVALASQVATSRVAAEQAEGEAAEAMARAGAIAADVLVAEQELARAREALEAAEESCKVGPNAVEPASVDGVPSLEPAPRAETCDEVVSFLQAAAAAEARVEALVTQKTASENWAQEVAQRGIAAREAAAAAAEQEGALRGSLDSIKGEERSALEAVLSAEAQLAEFKARRDSPLAGSGSQAALLAVAEEAAALAFAAGAAAAPQSAQLEAAPAAAAEEQSAGMSDPARSSRFFAAAYCALPVPEQHQELRREHARRAVLAAELQLQSARERRRCAVGALISGSVAGKPFSLNAAWAKSLRRRLGPVGMYILMALSLCLVVEMPFLTRRLLPGGVPPVSAAVSAAVIAAGPQLKRAMEAVRAALPHAEPAAEAHGAHEEHGGHGSADAGMKDVIVLLATSVIAVPLVSKLPGGSPVLGFLVGGAVIGPMALGLISNVETVKHIAEIGVVFLLFNIGLELSLERLQSMAKYVFGLGLAQMVCTTLPAALIVAFFTGISMPAAFVVGVGFAFSSTAVAMQVLGDRGEAASRHGRVAFSVLLLQDLAVVLVFMLVPLLAAGGADGSVQGAVLLAALGQAVVKTAVAICVIMAAGRVILRPVFQRIAELGNTEIFSATTLLVALGTSTLTSVLGLSAALGAFLAGLLLAETEYHLQVESDIAPYRGLLLGLFFMTVGMTINPALLVARFVPIVACIALLVLGKVGVMAAVGPWFGLSTLNSARAGMYIGPGGEFAFVTYGLAVASGLLSEVLVNELTLVIALSMAATPWLANVGADLRDRLEGAGGDMSTLQPDVSQVDDMNRHVIIAGFGRSGQLIAQLLSEQLIPFVALDMRSDRVQAGREEELPVFFGDAGSPAVLHSVGAQRACCAVICMDTPGANYRTVYSMHKHYPNVPVYVRAVDVADGLKLEKAGATACVPETLEPSLQLAAAVLAQLELPPDEVVTAIDSFRRRNISELKELALSSGTSLGYGAERSEEGAASGRHPDVAVAGG